MAACDFEVCNAPYHGKQPSVSVLKLYCQTPAQLCQYRSPVKKQTLTLRLQGLMETGEKEVAEEAVSGFMPLTQQIWRLQCKNAHLPEKGKIKAGVWVSAGSGWCERGWMALTEGQWKTIDYNHLHQTDWGNGQKFQGGGCRGYKANTPLSYGWVVLLSPQSISATPLSCRWYFVPWRLMTWGE